MFFDKNSPYLQEVTKDFFDSFKGEAFELFTSEITFIEIENAPSPQKEKLIQFITKINPTLLERNSDVEILAEAYIKREILPPNSIMDAFHIAFASAYEMDAVLSWNLRHISNIRRQEKVQSVNMDFGYHKPIWLVTPLEVIEYE